jgi:flagellar hook-basal body complex protein FliE
MSQNIDKITSLNGIANKLQPTGAGSSEDGLNFGDILKNSIEEVNDYQKKGEQAMADIATGEVKDLHQAALAIGKAETSMKLMLEVRNKAISAYKEIQRTQI